MGNPEVPRDDEAREFPPPPPPAPAATPSEPVLDAEVPGASVEAADEAGEPGPIDDDLAMSADLAMSRVEDLDIPPADIAVPDFTVPEPPEIPPLDETAAVLLADEKASTSGIGEPPGEDPAARTPLPATRSELRARTSGGDPMPSEPQRAADAASTSSVPPVFASGRTSSAVPAPPTPATPVDSRPDAPASDYSNPRGGDTYRGWPIVIFALLAVLLLAAVIGVVVLANNPPTFSAPQSSGTGVSESAPAGEPAPAVEQGCSELCAQVAAMVDGEVAGPTGDVAWSLDGAWQDAASPAASAVSATSAHFTSEIGDLRFAIMAFEDDAAVAAAGETLKSERSEPLTSESSVYEDGSGTSYVFADGTQQAILWHVPSDDDTPWLMLVEGPDDPAVFDFYLGLPF